MRVVALLALLAAFQPPSAPNSVGPKPPSPPQDVGTGQACTASELVGSWQIVRASSNTNPNTSWKHVTPTHFFVARVAPDGIVISGHGGPYTLANGRYTEVVAHRFGALSQGMAGETVSFQCQIDGDIWHIVGEAKGYKFDERWKRVAARPSP